MSFLLIEGDAEVLALRSESVDCVVTSIPYWRIRDYGPGAIGMEPTPSLFVASIVSVFREVWRVLRKRGTVWLNVGDSYAGARQGNKLPPGNGQNVHYTGIPEKSGDGLKPRGLTESSLGN